MTEEFRKESPRGLVALTRRRAKFGEHGFRVEQTSPTTIELRGPAPTDERREFIEVLRQSASATIERSGKDPVHASEIVRSSDTVDTVCLAAVALLKLQSVEDLLSTLQGCSEMSEARALGQKAALHAMRAGFMFSSLGLVENEMAIMTRAASLEGARLGGRMKVQSTVERDTAMARDILSRWENRRASGPSKTVMMAKIGSEHGLRRSASVAAIHRGLRLLGRK